MALSSCDSFGVGGRVGGVCVDVCVNIRIYLGHIPSSSMICPRLPVYGHSWRNCRLLATKTAVVKKSTTHQSNRRTDVVARFFQFNSIRSQSTWKKMKNNETTNLAITSRTRKITHQIEITHKQALERENERTRERDTVFFFSRFQLKL